MVEGYIVYESLYYVSEYIKIIEYKVGTFIWDDHKYEDKREGEILQKIRKR
jgi:hypothetical protein